MLSRENTESWHTENSRFAQANILSLIEVPQKSPPISSQCLTTREPTVADDQFYFMSNHTYKLASRVKKKIMSN